jgi:hypothetical protein
MIANTREGEVSWVFGSTPVARLDHPSPPQSSDGSAAS